MSEDARTSVGEVTMTRARPSAAVILVRRATSQFEVFMVRRVASAGVAPNAYVFPGGAVQETDYATFPLETGFTGENALIELTKRGGQPPSGATEALGLWRAALRELFEEAGVLFAADSSGEMLRISETAAARVAEFRRVLQAGHTTLVEILTQERLSLCYRKLRYFSHWITPERSPRRFDTRFFLAEMPAGQAALHCQIETSFGVWIQPRDALERCAAGHFTLVFPTRMHLQRLSTYQSLETLLPFAAQKPICTVQPIRVTIDGTEVACLPPEVDECW